MTTPVFGLRDPGAATREELEAEIARLNRVKRALMNRVERSMDLHGDDAFTLFEAAIGLEQQVQERTAALEQTMHELDRSSQQLAVAKEAADAANRAKSEFLATMSHELRAPLHAVLALAESLRSGVYDALTPKQVAAVKQQEESSRHLLALIDDVLDLSKIAAGKLEFESGPVDVASACQACLRLMHGEAQHKQIRLRTSLDSSVTMITANERRFKQILINLLSNAVKFTPEGGSVELTVRGDAGAGQVSFAVADTGVGIAEADMGLLFEPFAQIDSGLARQYPGTGLGLTLAKRLVELHGGSITVDSVPGEGSTFAVVLPWDASLRPVAMDRSGSFAESRAARAAVTTHDLDSAPSVLLAEDDPVAAITVVDYLSFHGFRVLTAKTGPEALERAQSLAPRLIVMDVQLPMMNGLEVIQRLREIPATMRTPIIAMTGLAMEGDEERCIEAGADAYISKPVTLHQLVDRINALLRSVPTRASGETSRIDGSNAISSEGIST